MTYKGDPVARGLDRISEKLVVDAPRGKIAPRMQAAFAVLLIALACAFMAAMAMGATGDGMLIMPVIWAGVALNLFGELRKPSGGGWDERQQLLRTNALLWAATIPLGLVVLWTFALGIVADDGLWRPQGEDQWEAVALFLVSLWSSTATFVAAWNTPAYAAQLEEDD